MRARKLLCTVYLRDSIMRHVADGSVDLLYVDAVAFVFGRAMLAVRERPARRRTAPRRRLQSESAAVVRHRRWLSLYRECRPLEVVMLDLPWAAAYRHAKTGVPRGSR